MNRNQNERIKNLEKPIPGCLGRMVNLFDLNTSIGSGNKLLTEKPHYEGSPVSSRCQSDRMNNKMILSELKPSNRKSNMTPIKMLIAQEMSKEECPKQSPPNLVAKLMGLDALPQPHILRGSKSRTHSEHNEIKLNQKDVLEIWQKGRYNNKESKNDKNMALVREKFMEAKRLSTDENLRQSKQFQEALEVLSSNKDLFLKFLQEPNSLFSHHNQNLQSLPPPPPPESRRITVLKPSKFHDAHKLTGSRKQINSNPSPNPNQPTRIVVLKPTSGKILASPPSSRTDDGFYGDLEDMDPPESRIPKPESPGGDLRNESHETLLSSVFSNGYIGDESSFSKSEVYYAAGNLSDSDAMSPVSRHSWDYINRFGSPYSSSSFTYSPESSSVCREAKKRLSERWAIMSFQEQRNIRRSSSTLGEMLALSDIKKSVESEEKLSDLSNKGQGNDGDCSPKSLVRSKSCGSRLGEATESKKVKKEELTKDKSGKSSLFKGLFFSKSRKSSSKQKSQKDDDRKIDDNESHSQCINDINGSLKKEEHLPEVVFSVTKPEIRGNANENQEQPSPISVLELELEDDDFTTGYTRSAKLKEHGVDPMKFNLLDKSPPIGSIARTLSWDESPVGPTKTSTPEEEEQEYFSYVQALLSVAGINGNSPENPLPPSLRDTYITLTGNHHHPISKQRHQRSTQRLVFDCVNEALISGTPLDHVWDRVKEWRQCGGDREEDGGSVAVRKEVVGEVWSELMRLEVDDIKKEIEEMLVEELVEELF